MPEDKDRNSFFWCKTEDIIGAFSTSSSYLMPDPITDTLLYRSDSSLCEMAAQPARRWWPSHVYLLCTDKQMGCILSIPCVRPHDGHSHGASPRAGAGGRKAPRGAHAGGALSSKQGQPACREVILWFSKHCWGWGREGVQIGDQASVHRVRHDPMAPYCWFPLKSTHLANKKM